ncbi:hypothetical protein [Tumebacillus flagellatus]|uniref:Uncharacterized protein n=1 Tax=Tumebacillus flagellatus TaxID=1157490 RepID=A0A074LLW4_9BACL|nr:hypothetical protein [Tumebacillus flagellatus]KEO81535.1 hypothetical protein EL26_20260 [Tumebacillus flagellatus]
MSWISFISQDEDRDLEIEKLRQELMPHIQAEYGYSLDDVSVTLSQSNHSQLDVQIISHGVPKLQFKLTDVKSIPALYEICRNQGSPSVLLIADLNIQTASSETLAYCHFLCMLLIRWAECILIESTDALQAPEEFRIIWKDMFEFHEFLWDDKSFWKGDDPAAFTSW